jgi:hypothetical protein
MSWSFGGKAPDVAFASECARVFAEGRKNVAGYPASVRALDAIETFVAQAPLNIAQGATIAFETNGHLDGDGRGAVTVKVTIADTPPEDEDDGA